MALVSKALSSLSGIGSARHDHNDHELHHHYDVCRSTSSLSSNYIKLVAARGPGSRVHLRRRPYAAARNQLVEDAAVTTDGHTSWIVPGAAATGYEAFWRKVPMYTGVATEEFMSYRWQVGHSVRSKEQLTAFLENVLPAHNQDASGFREDVLLGMELAPMSISLTPYLLSCIDWSNPVDDPIRKQFLPLASTRQPDHPMALRDTLSEQHQSPVPGLIHRYPDKACLISTTVCPIYCRFCYRSYVVGNETSTTKKHSFGKSNRDRWKEAFDYLKTHPQIEDLTISGGDMFFLSTDEVEYIGNTLLSIPHIRRFRFGTRGFAATPMRVLSDHTWTNMICSLVSRGRELGKHIALHLHFNHPNEITWVTELAALKLFQKGVTLRNQSVVLRGVNDSVETMSALIKKLGHNNIHPYYVYQGEMVKGVEDLRTPLSTIIQLEKKIQGLTAGFNVPKFILDLPLEGGKQLAHHYESYDPVKGIATFRSPVGSKDVLHTYCDPLHAVSTEVQEKWLSGALP